MHVVCISRLVFDCSCTRIYLCQHLPVLCTSSLVAHVRYSMHPLCDDSGDLLAGFARLHPRASALRKLLQPRGCTPLLTFTLSQLVWNIFLLCLGRHPLQNPHYIKPDIGKLPKSIVQQIPLVLYIPPPPGDSAGENPAVTAPPAAHSFPPKSSSATSSTSPAPKRRFAFFRRKAAKNKARTSPREGGDGAAEKRGAGAGKQPDSPVDGDDEAGDVPWDEMWEKGEHPFVRLEGNRAVCAICLMDFEEPKRVRGPGAKGATASPGGDEPKSTTREGNDGADAVQEIQVEEVTEEERDALKLDDAGEGPQPLRLLLCGHAFHVSIQARSLPQSAIADTPLFSWPYSKRVWTRG